MIGGRGKEESFVKEVTYAGRVVPGGGPFSNLHQSSPGRRPSHRRSGSGGGNVNGLSSVKQQHRRTRTFDSMRLLGKFGREGLRKNLLMSVDEQDELLSEMSEKAH